MFMRLMRFYEEHIRFSPDHESYVQGVKGHRFMMSGTSALPRSLRLKWFDLSGGRRILERYGTSEFSTCILTPLKRNEKVPDVRTPQNLLNFLPDANYWIGICWCSTSRLQRQVIRRPPRRNTSEDAWHIPALPWGCRSYSICIR